MTKLRELIQANTNQTPTFRQTVVTNRETNEFFRLGSALELQWSQAATKLSQRARQPYARLKPTQVVIVGLVCAIMFNPKLAGGTVDVFSSISSISASTLQGWHCPDPLGLCFFTSGHQTFKDAASAQAWCQSRHEFASLASLTTIDEWAAALEVVANGSRHLTNGSTPASASALTGVLLDQAGKLPAI